MLNSRMARLGIPAEEWLKRLRAYAQGTFTFGRGERPPERSIWAKALGRIEKCPKHGNAASSDLFGRAIACACGYHKASDKL